LGVTIAPAALRRFWVMLAHWHGQIWNASELGRSLGQTDKTVRSYLDLLTGTYLVRQLQPWYANLAKRQVKSPKVYLRDTGLLHALLTLPDRDALYSHPKVGASWEGFCIEQALRALRPAEAYFWSTYSGAEIDLVFPWRGRLYGIEVKWQEQPSMTRSLHTALADLDLAHAWVLHPGPHRFPLHERVTALPASHLPALAREVMG
jgi:predicted AAA+ superfamily ATPase